MKNSVKLFVTILSLFSISAFAQTEKSFQFSLISPLGTNGSESHNVINDYSFNALGGYSYANNVFEFGGLYNINREYTKGFQFAGLTNITGKGSKSVHFAGLANVANDQEGGAQISGLTNIAAKGDVKLQIGGLINVAKNAGTQIGFINVADSVSGVPVGFINIVKKNGKQEFELGFSDAMNTYASFKLGTDALYTIFSAGVNYLDMYSFDKKDPVQIGLGLGFGTDVKIKNGYATQFELIGYGLTEDKKFTKNLNLLTQFKITGSKEFKSGMKVFAGPVANLTISQHKDANDQIIGTNLPPYSLYEHHTDNIQLDGWVGFTLGLRY